MDKRRERAEKEASVYVKYRGDLVWVNEYMRQIINGATKEQALNMAIITKPMARLLEIEDLT